MKEEIGQQWRKATVADARVSSQLDSKQSLQTASNLLCQLGMCLHVIVWSLVIECHMSWL